MSIVPEFACPMTAAREFVARPPARRLSSASYWVCGFETDFQWSGEKDSISSILPATFTPGTTPATCFGDRVRAGLARAQPCLTVVGVSLCVGRRSSARMAQDHWRKVEKARQRLVLCRLMIDIMRTVHGAYVPASEPFGVRLETCFIGLCVAIGDLDGRPFSIAKIAAYMRVPRTTVIRKLAQLKSWGLIDREGRRYYLREKTLNSAIGMRSHQQVRRILNRATAELAILDVLPD